MFGKDKSKEARFLLGGTIEDFTCWKYSRSWTKACEITVIWEVLDKMIDDIRYKVRTRYYHAVDFNKLKADFPKMVGGAMLSLMKREKFVGLLRKDAEVADGDKKYTPADIQRCTLRCKSLPKGLPQALNATVVIKRGSTIGSGFFVSPDGFILTAAHVVAGITTVSIRTHEGTETNAVVLRRNQRHDIALLKTDSKSPGCLKIGSTQKVGEAIWSIGAPASEELAFSVSKGTISGNREFGGNKYLQTDTSLNPGNSGGPLVNARGEAVAPS